MKEKLPESINSMSNIKETVVMSPTQLLQHIDLTGHLPASVLGDMWGRFWNNLYQHMVPYPDKPSIDPTPELVAQNYTVEKMYATGDDFYASMGLIRVPDTFYNLSMLRKPEDGREVVCHATAWDFYDKKVCVFVQYYAGSLTLVIAPIHYVLSFVGPEQYAPILAIRYFPLFLFRTTACACAPATTTSRT
jgi:hypothetical protein